MCVYVYVCVFGKERQNRTAVPSYSWQRHSEEQTELSMLRREEGWKKGFSGTEGCWSPLTCCPVTGASGRPGIQRCSTSIKESGGWWRYRGDETSCWDHCAEGLRGTERGFQLTVFVLAVPCVNASEQSTWLLKDTQCYLRGSAGLLPEWHLGRLMSWNNTGQTIWNNTFLFVRTNLSKPTSCLRIRAAKYN